MEKITVNICGRNYYLKTDDSSDRILGIGKSLEKLINEYKEALVTKSEEEILTLVALNVLDDADKMKAQIDSEKIDLEQKINDIKVKMNEQEQSNLNALNENISSAESELVQIASVKDEENDMLRQKIQEYEKTFEKMIKERDDEIRKLTDSFNSAKSELEHIASVKENDNAKLRNTLNSYESTFDLYVKSKEEEILRLHKQIEDNKIEIENLRQRLAAITDDGQITIC